MRMREEPGVGHALDTRHVPHWPPGLGSVIFVDHVAFDVDFHQTARRREILRTQIGDQEIAIRQLQDVIDPGKFFHLRRGGYQRAGRNVERVGDVATKQIRAHQPTRKQIFPAVHGDGVMVHVMRLVQEIRGDS